MFLSDLDVKFISDKIAEVTKPFIWQDDDTEEIIEVPPGFRTDFASVPRLPFVFWLVGDCAHKPAVIHDYLYQTHKRSKPAADWILLRAMKDCQIIFWRRWLIYLGVLCFGWFVYSGYKKRNIVFEYKSRNIEDMIF